MDSLLTAWSNVNYHTVAVAKAAVAAAGTLVLIWDYLARRRGATGFRRLRDTLLALVGVAAFAAWWDFGRFHYGAFIQVHEHYHYYLGAKYFPELEYTR